MNLKDIKEYGPFGFVLTSALIAAAISYGSSQATASNTFSNHEDRLGVLEVDDKQYGKDISSIQTDIRNTKEMVHDIWIDLGHREAK